jgi:uncharacterized protein (TIGR00725 family)
LKVKGSQDNQRSTFNLQLSTWEAPVLILGVIGAGECDAATATVAEAVGREIARRGAALVCGGLGGVMAAACRGARSAGGLTIGILPGVHRADANPWVDIPVVTGLDQARNVLVVRTAQAIIAVGGEYGTLSEIAFALKLGVPVVGLDTWQLARRGRPVSAIVEARTPVEAVEKAIALIGA